MLPRLVKDLVCTIDGVGYAGKATAKLPELARKMEEYRSGGMSGAIEIDLGQEKMEMEVTIDGHDMDVLKHYGAYGVSALGFRFNGSVEMDDLAGTSTAIEILCRGRINKIDMGEKKPGEKDSTTLSLSLASYKFVEDNCTIIEIDNANNILFVNGQDLLEKRRANLKL